jgi:hypothetical protein
MAGIRGAQNPVPTKGKAPTGIFSTKGSQKQDPAGPNKELMGYAKDCGKSMMRGKRDEKR